MSSSEMPSYSAVSWSDVDAADLEQARQVDLWQEIISAMQLRLQNFMYEPMNARTLDAIKDGMAQVVSSRCEGCSAVQNVEIDDMADLYLKKSECAACAETSSYEEYQIRRAAQNLPDEAGSEREWQRMSQYRPGQIGLNVTFAVPVPVQKLEYRITLN